MFEKYNIDELYTCEIESWIPWSIESSGEGRISITGEDVGTYSTIVYKNNGRYVDIYHPDRIIFDMSKKNINRFCCSLDGCLYVLDDFTLRKYSDSLSEKQKSAKTLQRLPFGKKRLLKKEK